MLDKLAGYRSLRALGAFLVAGLFAFFLSAVATSLFTANHAVMLAVAVPSSVLLGALVGCSEARRKPRETPAEPTPFGWFIHIWGGAMFFAASFEVFGIKHGGNGLLLACLAVGVLQALFLELMRRK